MGARRTWGLAVPAELHAQTRSGVVIRKVHVEAVETLGAAAVEEGELRGVGRRRGALEARNLLSAFVRKSIFVGRQDSIRNVHRRVESVLIAHMYAIG